MPDSSEVISTYVHAKDCNRPWLMSRAFAKDAQLGIVVKTDAIAFPSAASGVEAITDTLVRQFSRENENVYTFCLARAPEGHARKFDCDWLVGMSRRDTGDVRVGCGRYEWVFAETPGMLAASLRITIEVMEVLARVHVQPVMRWLSGLAYPWCPAGAAIRDMPHLDGLEPVSDFLGKRAKRE